MANIIDRDYFYEGLAIPQATDEKVEAELTNLISQYETEYLEKTLGYELAKNFKAGIAVDPGPPEQKWIDLRDGVEFTDRLGRLVKWKGFKFTEGDKKCSPIANYVFYRYHRHKSSDFTAGGEAKTKTQNADPLSGARRQSEVYNQMVEWNRVLWELLYVKQDIYLVSSGLGPNWTADYDVYTFINPMNS